MLKHIIIIIVLSLLVIVGMSYAHQGVQWLVDGHNWISEKLMKIFSGSEAGDLSRKFIALLAIPVIVGFIPAFIYWLIRRKWFPYAMELVWVIWLIQTSAIAILSH